MNIKDLPGSPTKDWKDLEAVPEDRHLTTDIMPFPEFLAMRKRIGGRNALAPQTAFAPEALEELQKNRIADAIKDDYVFSRMSMEPDCVLFLEEVIEMYKPQKILELGTGLSTLILSAKQKEQRRNDEKASYITIDQDREHCANIMYLADKAGVREAISPHVFDMCLYKVGDDFTHEEKALPCYDFDEEKLHKALEGTRPDMVIIDGPIDERTQHGVSFAKTLTLPILRQYAAPGALFLMNTAYIDTDLFALEQWEESGSAEIIGIKAVGSGLAIAIAT